MTSANANYTPVVLLGFAGMLLVLWGVIGGRFRGPGIEVEIEGGGWG